MSHAERPLGIYHIVNHTPDCTFTNSVVIAGCPTEARTVKTEDGKDYILNTDVLSVNYLGRCYLQPHNNSARIVCICWNH